MIVTGIDLLWDLRIDLRCQRGLRMSYRMQTGALILVTMSWIYHQTCSGGATWGKAAMYMGDFGPLYILFQPISISQLDFLGRLWNMVESSIQSNVQNGIERNGKR